MLPINLMLHSDMPDLSPKKLSNNWKMMESSMWLLSVNIPNIAAPPQVGASVLVNFLPEIGQVNAYQDWAFVSEYDNEV